MKSPVLLLIFNRPDYCEELLKILEQAQPTKLYIAADGPRETVPEDVENCVASRAVFDSINWPCEVRRLYRKRNLGCGLGVSSAITWFFQHEQEGIILEDDLRPSLQFFDFCDAMLEKYRNDERVMQITGDNFQFGRKRGSHPWYFSRFNHIWGWATWARAWQHYHFDIQNLSLFEKERIDRLFPNKTHSEYWKRIFRLIHQHKIDTWDYQWAYASFYHEGLVVTPNANLVRNVGFDNRGTHTKGEGFTSNLEVELLEGNWDVAPRVEYCEEADAFVSKTVFCPDAELQLKHVLDEVDERIKLGLFEAAFKLLKRIHCMYDDFLPVLQLLTLCSIKMGNVQESLLHIKKLLKVAPQDPQTKNLLAMLSSMQQEIHIAVAGDENYSEPLQTVIGSALLGANPDDKLVFHVLDGGLSEKTRLALLKLCKMGKARLEFPAIPKTELPKHRCAPCAYYRVMLPSILPNLDKILYLDCDVLVLGSLQELWATPLVGETIACARDAIDYMRHDRTQTDHFARLGFKEGDHYFNSGVMLMNLEKMRKRNLERRFFIVREQMDKIIRYSDQDVFNILYRKDYVELDQKWNYQAPMAYFPKETLDVENFTPAIMHYTTDAKPWKDGVECPFAEIYHQMKERMQL